MRFYARFWEEPRDEHDAWGGSWWYFETDDEGWILRQVTRYQHGPTLAYDEDRIEDELGGLGDQPLVLDEFSPYAIGRDAFERARGAARA